MMVGRALALVLVEEEEVLLLVLIPGLLEEVEVVPEKKKAVGKERDQDQAYWALT